MSDKEHSESEFYYSDELRFQENSQFTVLNYNQLGGRMKETAKRLFIGHIIKPYKKDCIGLRFPHKYLILG